MRIKLDVVRVDSATVKGDSDCAEANIVDVSEEEWQTHFGGPFDSKTAVRIAADPPDSAERGAWDFYVSVDNASVHLNSRGTGEPLEAVRKAFATSIVFVALAIIRGESADGCNRSQTAQRGGPTRPESLPITVDRITAHFEPVFLPVTAALRDGGSSGFPD